MILQEAQL